MIQIKRLDRSIGKNLDKLLYQYLECANFNSLCFDDISTLPRQIVSTFLLIFKHHFLKLEIFASSNRWNAVIKLPPPLTKKNYKVVFKFKHFA